MTYLNNDTQEQQPPPYEARPIAHQPHPTKNRVTDAYKNAFFFGLARWAFSAAVLALCALQFGDQSTLTFPPYVAALAYNVACASIHLLLPGPPVGPRSRHSPTPPLWYTVILGLSLFAWIPAFSLLFAMTKDDQSGNYGNISLAKRAYKSRHGTGWVGSNTPFTQTLAAGVLGVAITIFNLGQAFYVVKLHRANFLDYEIAAAYDKATSSWWSFGRDRK